ncbi:MAG TPA: mismatch-specific DNA-glycosylase [Acetobacteraceae bacterium]|jgi:TDG/mug DNA glycosylase family protein
MTAPSNSLPDLLRDGLGVVFVGINPSLYSVAQGHYFARRSNRFWRCFSRSVLSEGARQALGVASLEPRHDRALLEHGFGFTDVVKRASARAGELSLSEFAAGVAHLTAKLDHHKPCIACFHGVTGYKHVQRALLPGAALPLLGTQELRIGVTRCFLVPSPSAANAHFTPADQTRWYDRLAEFLHSV